MELPSSSFQLQCGQILLIGALLVVKDEKEAFDVHSEEVGLPVEHG